MFGLGRKNKKSAEFKMAEYDAQLEATTRALIAGTTLSLSEHLKADRAHHGMETLSTVDSLELKAMGF